jgi:hypothetical protein
MPTTPALISGPGATVVTPADAEVAKLTRRKRLVNIFIPTSTPLLILSADVRFSCVYVV